MTDIEGSRPPLDASLLDALLAESGGWTRAEGHGRAGVQVVGESPSTNADLAARATRGALPGLVLVAEHQTAGRGRLDRGWLTPARSALTISVLLRPTVPMARWTWLPLLTGLAVADALTTNDVRGAGLKWPNDVLVGDQKIAGILVEVIDTPAGHAAVVGIGLNVHQRRDELPERPGGRPTSVALETAGTPDRTRLLADLLIALGHRYDDWLAVDGDPTRAGTHEDRTRGGGLLEGYTESCVTLGRQVSVQLPSAETITGTATAVDAEGRLHVVPEGGDGRALVVGAGDVVHARLTGRAGT